MTGADWHDPFAQDETARERERRRSEREARRRAQRQSLGEKVVEAQAPADESATATAVPEAAPPAAPLTEERPAAPEPSTDGAGAPPIAPRPRRSYGGGSNSGSTRSLRIRQFIGLLIIAAVAAVLVFVVAKVIDRIDGADAPIAPPKAAPKTTSITIPEGLDRDQIASVAKDAGLKGDYAEATKKPPKHSGFDLADYDAKGAPNLEGFLFPDTWDDLPKKPTVHDLVERQLADFQQQIKGIDMSYAKSKNLNVYDIAKIASIIEKEIAVPEERPLAAAVIYNRLAANNPLGMDSTIRYYLQNYDQPLTESELAQDEPYNTRTRTGLPPTPISNPGLASLEAAAKPAKSDAFYFVIKPGTCNEHTFVKTEEEFQQAEAAYQQALQEQGGSPTDC
ncbi:MAG TPA: endolytic transglycosylase MltG [Solirubrobacterales bacterium]|nr:endolytic transglycosylase MltG [Solirubrobacterales bacterium]